MTDAERIEAIKKLPDTALDVQFDDGAYSIRAWLLSIVARQGRVIEAAKARCEAEERGFNSLYTLAFAIEIRAMLDAALAEDKA